MQIRASIVIATAFLGAIASERSMAAPAPDPKTAAAVRAADDAWGAAEVKGDAAFLERLLMPRYQSVGPDGKSTTRAAILGHARARKGSADLAAKVAAWEAAHPSRAEVMITGDIAILTWVSSKPKSDGLVRSCDIFVYDRGRWRALYSQHTSASS